MRDMSRDHVQHGEKRSGVGVEGVPGRPNENIFLRYKRCKSRENSKDNFVMKFEI